ncbi:hypothetical protein JB92DRAFT_2837424 [Gautieria morchelliformis]|nr:hypothetical protein JB92DRAFT_2837424 [Gautieria morchelliformis]
MARSCPPSCHTCAPSFARVLGVAHRHKGCAVGTSGKPKYVAVILDLEMLMNIGRATEGGERAVSVTIDSAVRLFSIETPWDGNDGMDLQMLTEVMDSSEVDEVTPNRSSLEPGLKFILDCERRTITTRRPDDSASWSVARALRGEAAQFQR